MKSVTVVEIRGRELVLECGHPGGTRVTGMCETHFVCDRCFAPCVKCGAPSTEWLGFGVFCCAPCRPEVDTNYPRYLHLSAEARAT